MKKKLLDRGYPRQLVDRHVEQVGRKDQLDLLKKKDKRIKKIILKSSSFHRIIRIYWSVLQNLSLVGDYQRNSIVGNCSFRLL